MSNAAAADVNDAGAIPTLAARRSGRGAVAGEGIENRGVDFSPDDNGVGERAQT
jgi:hypothetical protein